MNFISEAVREFFIENAIWLVAAAALPYATLHSIAENSGVEVVSVYQLFSNFIS